jgi:hypothetical protein
VGSGGPDGVVTFTPVVAVHRPLGDYPYIAPDQYGGVLCPYVVCHVEGLAGVGAHRLVETDRPGVLDHVDYRAVGGLHRVGVLDTQPKLKPTREPSEYQLRRVWSPHRVVSSAQRPAVRPRCGPPLSSSRGLHDTGGKSHPHGVPGLSSGYSPGLTFSTVTGCRWRRSRHLHWDALRVLDAQVFGERLILLPGTRRRRA